MKINKKEVAILIGFSIAVIVSFFTQSNIQATQIRENTLRLHIIANSDSSKDQAIKSLVKDNIQRNISKYHFTLDDIQAPNKDTIERMEKIKTDANIILSSIGVDYKASCTIEPFYFKTMDSENTVLPQGEYNAVTIQLGDARGKNWWCILYPDIAGDIFSQDIDKEKTSLQEFSKDTAPIFKLKSVEIYEDIKNAIVGKKEKDYVN